MPSTQFSPVLVVGASGKVGSEVVRLLEARGVTVRAASRTPQARKAQCTTTEWVRLDLEQPSSFETVLQGIQTVLLMARPGDERPQETALPLLEAMERAGVTRVVNLTAMGCDMRPDFGLRKVELALESSGMGYTHIRPNFFMQIFCVGPHFAQISRLRQVRLPAGDARISFIDARDVAAVAARCILETEHQGRAYTLTGAEALSHADVTQIISRVSDAAVHYVPLDESEARSEFTRAGIPAENVERLLGFYRIVRTGAAGAISPDVERVLGSAPRGFNAFAEQNASTWNRVARP